MGPLQQVHVLLRLWSWGWMQCSRQGLTRAEWRGTVPSLDIIWMQTRTRLDFCAMGTHCQVTLSCSSTYIPKSFSSGLHPSHSPPRLCLCLGWSQPTCRKPLVRFAQTHLPSLSSSLWVHPFPEAPTTPHCSVSLPNLLRVHCTSPCVILPFGL